IFMSAEVRLPIDTQRGINPHNYEDSRRVVGRLSGAKRQRFERERCPTTSRGRGTCLTFRFSHKHNTLAPFLLFLLCSLIEIKIEENTAVFGRREESNCA